MVPNRLVDQEIAFLSLIYCHLFDGYQQVDEVKDFVTEAVIEAEATEIG
ncbi:MAG TPA: hypothetical protein V6D11_12365 [Waterburya sp.]|jgi:hypothetical protein